MVVLNLEKISGRCKHRAADQQPVARKRKWKIPGL